MYIDHKSTIPSRTLMMKLLCVALLVATLVAQKAVHTQMVKPVVDTRTGQMHEPAVEAVCLNLVAAVAWPP
jgi:hypothetical protein